MLALGPANRGSLPAVMLLAADHPNAAFFIDLF